MEVQWDVYCPGQRHPLIFKLPRAGWHSCDRMAPLTLWQLQRIATFTKKESRVWRRTAFWARWFLCDRCNLPAIQSNSLPASLILQVSSHFLWNGVLIMVRWRWWCHSFAHFDLRCSPLTLLSHSFSIIWYGISLICFLACLFWHLYMESSRKKCPRGSREWLQVKLFSWASVTGQIY